MEIDFNLISRLKELIISSFNDAQKINNINVQKKEFNDIVTDVDLFMEKKIVNSLREWFPNHSIDSEEFTNINKDSEYEWLIDPIDGTINFSNGIPMFSTTMALRKNNEAILGVIYDYTNEKFYYALKGEGAYCNGERIHVSEKDNLSDSVISFCLTSHYNIEKINEVLEVEKYLAPKVRGLRLIVSAAIELAWCAEGKIDGCLNIKSSKGLGSSAGKLLVAEAGGKVTNIKGKPRENIDTMLVTNGKIHKKLVNALKYVAFVGNITEVIEIGEDHLSSPIKKYLAGKAYSQAMAGAKTGLNSKLLTVMSGLRKNELDNMISEIKRNNIDTSYIVVSNDIDNDIKMVFTDNVGKKIREEDILKGSAEALTEEIILKNEEMLIDAAYIICQTKINKAALKRVIEIGYKNNVPVVLTTSRPKEISIINNDENKELINKVNLIICNKNELYEIFGKDITIDEKLKQYPNKLILIDDNEVKFFDGNDIIIIKDENVRFKEVGAEDIFIGNFVRALVDTEKISEAIKEGLKNMN